MTIPPLHALSIPRSLALIGIILLALVWPTMPPARAADTGRALVPSAQFMQVSAGNKHTCGLRDDRSVTCWGYNAYGQATPPSGSFLQISAGDYHTCSLKDDRSVACWGNNEAGQATPPSGSFSEVSAGDFHTCGLKDDRSVACWGRSHEGQATPPGGSFVQLSAGAFYTCGLKDDRSIACWGLNEWGQATPPSGSFIQVSAGSLHACGLKPDGSIVCWGYNVAEPTPSSGVSFVQISAGSLHNCGLRSDRSIVCWGRNLYGQATPRGGSFAHVSAGNEYTCGLTSAGSIACWGLNDFGQATPPSDHRVITGLQALYDFNEGAGTVVYDRSGVDEPLNLIIQKPTQVQWGAGSVQITGFTLIASDGPASKLVEAAKASNELTAEAWVTPADLKQYSARLITISASPTRRNFSLIQGFFTSKITSLVSVRLRTTASALDGGPALLSPANSLPPTLTHIVFTRTTNGAMYLYINGVEQAHRTLGGTLDTWASYPLLLGGELPSGRSWKGTYHLVAFYDRALSAAEVLENYSAGPEP